MFSRDFQRDAFLLDSAYPGGGRVSQHLVYILFGRRERWELPPPRAKDGLAFLVGPRSELFIGLICRVVHEHAVYIDSCHSQVIDDRQSGCVDVAPVDDVTALQIHGMSGRVPGAFAPSPSTAIPPGTGGK